MNDSPEPMAADPIFVERSSVGHMIRSEQLFVQPLFCSDYERKKEGQREVRLRDVARGLPWPSQLDPKLYFC
jgi:hypothetical protein